jgi:hypothetical protein
MRCRYQGATQFVRLSTRQRPERWVGRRAGHCAKSEVHRAPISQTHPQKTARTSPAWMEVAGGAA